MQIPTDQIANLLENEPGYLKFKFPSEYMSTDSPKPYFLEFTQKIGTPLSQNTQGDTVLSVKNEGWDKMTQEPEVQIQTENLVFTPIVVMSFASFACNRQKLEEKTKS